MFKVVVSLNEGTQDYTEAFITLNDMPIMKLPDVAKPYDVKDYNLSWKNGLFEFRKQQAICEAETHGYTNPMIVTVEGNRSVMEQYYKILSSNHQGVTVVPG